MGIFRIQANEFSWITGPEDDPDDLCLHGHVTVQIGETVLEDYGTVSATALYLLKSIEQDKLMTPHSIQMIPCCGHFYIPNEDLTEVEIIGCDTGTDWSILHEGDHVRLILPSGAEEVVDLQDYQREVFRFADQIEAFYQACKPKHLPANEFERRGYAAFWREWHRRRGQGLPVLQFPPDQV